MALPRLLSAAAVVLPMLMRDLPADELVVSAGSRSIAVGESTTVRLPGFDPDLGILRSVTLSASARVDCLADVENTGASPLMLLARGTLRFRIGSEHAIGPLFAYSAEGGPSLGAFDGALDFAGSSGITGLHLDGVSGDEGTTHILAIYGNDARLRSFVGVGVELGFDALGAGVGVQFGDPAGLISVLRVASLRGVVQARYVYEPLPARFCQNAGAGPLGCPCAPIGAGERGCGNSLSSLGAGLEATGIASLSTDSLSFVATNLPEGTCFLLQATNFAYASIPFGDGRLCLHGRWMRIGSMRVRSSSASFPAPLGPTLSSIAGVTAPCTRSYQLAYQDRQRFCTPARWNATNGIAIRWTP